MRPFENFFYKSLFFFFNLSLFIFTFEWIFLVYSLFDPIPAFIKAVVTFLIIMYLIFLIIILNGLLNEYFSKEETEKLDAMLRKMSKEIVDKSFNNAAEKLEEDIISSSKYPKILINCLGYFDKSYQETLAKKSKCLILKSLPIVLIGAVAYFNGFAVLALNLIAIYGLYSFLIEVV